jgi:hypothetical protein
MMVLPLVFHRRTPADAPLHSLDSMQSLSTACRRWSGNSRTSHPRGNRSLHVKSNSSRRPVRRSSADILQIPVLTGDVPGRSTSLTVRSAGIIARLLLAVDVIPGSNICGLRLIRSIFQHPAGLERELHKIVENVLATHPNLAGNPGNDQTEHGSRSVSAVAAVRAAASRGETASAMNSWSGPPMTLGNTAATRVGPYPVCLSVSLAAEFREDSFSACVNVADPNHDLLPLKRRRTLALSGRSDPEAEGRPRAVLQ